jgi:hypothetical protein
VSTTVSQQGEQLRFVNWVQNAWIEIQNACEDWGFMRMSYLLGLPAGFGTTFPTTFGMATYPLGTDPGTTCMVDPNMFGKWDRFSFRDYTTTNLLKSDEIYLDYITFDEWRDAYMLGSLRQVRTRPVAVAIAPDNSICLAPIPDGNYTIEGDYWRAPQKMVLDTDVPVGLQSQFDMLIVYAAMRKYASYESAPEVEVRAEREYTRMLRQLASKFMPELMDPGALA